MDGNLRKMVLMVLSLFLFKSVDMVSVDTDLSSSKLTECVISGPLSRCSCSESQLEMNRHVICDSQLLRSVPSNISGLVSLKVTGDDIQILDDAVPYPYLTILHLEKNRIRYIADSCFRDLRHLTTLSLADNKISSLSHNTFDGLISLELLVLSGNRLYEVRSEVISGNVLPALQILKLDRCSLYYIEPNSFSGLMHLTLLDFSSNYLRSFPLIGDEKGLFNLTHVNASDNLLTQVDGTFSDSLPSITHLHLDRNLITELIDGTFRDSLNVLTLRGNRISSVGVNSLRPLRDLRFLDLSYNTLSRLNSSEISWDGLDRFLIHDNPWDCTGCGNSWLVDESIVIHWNFESNVTCAFPADLYGKNVYQKGMANGSIFRRCKLATSTTTLLLAVGVPVLLLIPAVILFVKCMSRRQREKLRTQSSGETTLLAYTKMKKSSPFTMVDEEEQEL